MHAVMASAGCGVGYSSMDSSPACGITDTIDSLNECGEYGDSLTMYDGPPLYPGGEWSGQDASSVSPVSPVSSVDRGLYSASLSWDPPKARRQHPEEESSARYPSAFDILTPSQQEKLRSINMPEHLQYHSQHSPNSEGDRRKSVSVSSPDQPGGGRKRKSSTEADDEDEENGQPPPIKKTAHNMIEKRYRTNLNDKIAALRDSVPSLRAISKTVRGEDAAEDQEDLQGLTPAHKLNKATVLSKATEYIRHLEKRNTRLTNENTHMKARIAAFERLLLSVSPPINSFPTQGEPYRYPQESPLMPQRNATVMQGADTQGLVEASEDVRRHQASSLTQPGYAASHEIYQDSPNENRVYSGPWQMNGGYFGKMMVGSLAALMILEGFGEKKRDNEGSNDRGLFALPSQIFGHIGRPLGARSDISVLGYHAPVDNVLSLLKLVLLFGTLLYVFVPSYFIKPAARKAKSEFASQSLVGAPSLASPIQVRRQAWLTAIQTIWVPRHNFILEAAALFLKMAKLSLRNAIGWYGYSILTGITEQQEAARVKTWVIALDAQLAGGDIEINKNRLTLTLLASCTLPDTPARLMLKAVHIRILLWELGNSKFNGLAAKLARSNWNEARQLQQLITHARGSSADVNLQDAEALPDYLAALLEQECDDVLVDCIVQRAYNLAFNLPTANNAIGSTEGMDSVVDDFAIRSPLDAISAWFSSLILQRGLAVNLKNKSGENKKAMQAIRLAIKTAPNGSIAQIHALIARAVLSDESRDKNIAAACQVLSTPGLSEGENKFASMLVNTTISTVPLDLRLSYDCAMAIAHLERPSTSDSQAAYAIANKIQLTNLSLLSFTAAFELLKTLAQHREAVQRCSQSMESMAGTLRIWIGGRDGEKSGLPKKTKEYVVEACLSIMKRLVGMDEDTGYASMSEPEDDDGC